MAKKSEQHIKNVSDLSWKRLSVEAFTIFLAITLGFFAENYREALSDRGREREMLEQLLDDLANDIEEIRPVLNSNELRENALTWFSNHANQESLTSDSVQVVLNPLRQEPQWIYIPGTSAFSSLKSSGRLDLIRDPSLRDKIVFYYEDRIPPQIFRNRAGIEMENDWWDQLAPYVAQVPRRELDLLPDLVVTDLNGIQSDQRLHWSTAELGNMYHYQVMFFEELVELNGELVTAVQDYLE